jgi:hypothetical protein
MNLIAIHPIKPLLQAWKRFRMGCGGKFTRVTGDKRKQTEPGQKHHRHVAFLEFP